jgi:hypothetical protein
MTEEKTEATQESFCRCGFMIAAIEIEIPILAALSLIIAR